MNTKQPNFQSFIMAGYECTAALNKEGRRLDLLGDTRHDEYCRTDYKLIKELGITTVREGLNWSWIEKGNKRYDFSRFEKIMSIGKEEGMQQIWDLNHFDFPDHINPLAEDFPDHFAQYAQKALNVIRTYQNGTLYIVPINEISFFSWIGGEQAYWSPFGNNPDQALQLKKQLVKAAIAAIDTLWLLDKDIRFIHTDPLMNRVVCPQSRIEAQNHVDYFNNITRFEGWDMIAGKRYPEIGGNPKYLDIIGINYYFHNQEWVGTGGDKLTFEPIEWDNQARVSCGDIFTKVYEQYNRPIIISETGSYGQLRMPWWKRTLKEISDVIEQGLPIMGVCAYPTVDRPEDAGFLRPNSGLWDFDYKDNQCTRIPHTQTLHVIKSYNSSQYNNI